MVRGDSRGWAVGSWATRGLLLAWKSLSWQGGCICGVALLGGLRAWFLGSWAPPALSGWPGRAEGGT